ncbi:GPP34 family phosphoprotein [Nocardia abscessus]|uniref:GPP34 family phosphoprotein n=1 Tax=Nocardia abscessus TaxID=120957 RepID=UPI0005BDF816
MTNAQLPGEHAKYIRSYAYWSVLRPARRRAARRHYSPKNAHRDRLRIRVAIKLLTDLAADAGAGRPRSARLDSWVGRVPDRAGSIAGFIAWARSQRITVESVLSAVDTVPKILPDRDRRVVTRRVKEIAAGDWASKAARDAVQAVDAALTAAVVVSAVATGSV